MGQSPLPWLLYSEAVIKDSDNVLGGSKVGKYLAIKKTQARFVLKELSSSNASLRDGDVLRHPLLPLSLQEMN